MACYELHPNKMACYEPSPPDPHSLQRFTVSTQIKKSTNTLCQHALLKQKFSCDVARTMINEDFK